jgi:hypothetical protein
VRGHFEPLKRVFSDPRLARSPVLFVAGVALALAALWLREPALFTEPTLGQDDVLCFAAHYGRSTVLYHHAGAVHLLPMLSSWVFAHALPESFVPYAYSFTTLLLSAVAPATLLLPAMERWLPLWPERGVTFLLLIALPLDTASLVASMAYQHLHYLLMTFFMLAFAAAPHAADWFEASSRLKLAVFSGIFALFVASAPLSPVLVLLPAYALWKGAPRRRATRPLLFAIFAVACLLVYAAFGISTEHAFVVRANLLGDPKSALELIGHFGILLIERVFFETFFGTSSRLWLSNRLDLIWVVTLLGMTAAALIFWLFARRRRRGVYAGMGAGFALYAAVALPLFAVLGRWHLHATDAWYSTTFRYFVPSAKLLVLALVILAAPDWERVLRSRWLVGSVVAWVAVLNLLDNPRYGGAVASVLTARSRATSLHDLARDEQHALSRRSYREFEAIEQLGRTLAPGEERAHTIAPWDITVTVRGRGSARP